MTRIRQSVAAWFAIIAVLANAFTPVVVRAMVPGAGVRYFADVCSASGAGVVDADRAAAMRSGSLAAKRGGESRPLAHAVDHCPTCCSHAGLAVPSTPIAASLYAFPGVAPSPRLDFVAPWTSDAWPPVQSRAPPASA